MADIKIPLFKVFMAPTVGDAVTKTLYSNFVGQGPKVEEFEANLKDYFNNNRLVTLNSATSGEHLALRLLQQPSKSFVHDGMGQLVSGWPGLNKGDTILASPLTCLASNSVIIFDGYKVKWVDIDTNTLNMDLDDLARKITPETKVIMLPLWGGMPVNMTKLQRIQDDAAKMYGFRPAVIIDAAHAMGSYFNHKLVCNFGHITSYSLQAIKHVTSIDGGVLVLPHQELTECAKLLRWYGLSRAESRIDFRSDNDVAEIGTKWHMNDVNASIGIENFRHVHEITDKHRENAKFFNTELSQPGKFIRGNPVPIDGVTLLNTTANSDSSYWIYTILVEHRDDFMLMMADAGIQVSRVHERTDKHSVFKEFRSQLPNLESIIDNYVCIPVHHGVGEEERSYIVEQIKKGW